jgi:predicted nuclease of predicted toxin-antitoxin system
MPAIRGAAIGSPGSGGMRIWLDAQLSPALEEWITDTFGFAAHSVRDLGLREAKDFQIFLASREADAVV